MGDNQILGYLVDSENNKSDKNKKGQRPGADPSCVTRI